MEQSSESPKTFIFNCLSNKKAAHLNNAQQFNFQYSTFNVNTPSQKTTFNVFIIVSREFHLVEVDTIFLQFLCHVQQMQLGSGKEFCN